MSQHHLPKRIWLDLSQIAPNPLQPRKVFSATEIEDLAASILDVGLLQQISVREIPNDKAFDDEVTHWLIAGEKRSRALRLLVERGQHSGRIEVEQYDVDDLQMMQMTMDENLQRSDINPLDKAWGFAALERLGLTQAKIGERYRLTQPAVSNFIRLLKLPDPVQLLMRGDEQHPPELSAGHGMALLMLKTPQDQITWSEKAGNYSVKNLERELRAFLEAENDRLNPPLLDPPTPPKVRETKPSEIYIPPVVDNTGTEVKEGDTCRVKTEEEHRLDEQEPETEVPTLRTPDEEVEEEDNVDSSDEDVAEPEEQASEIKPAPDTSPSPTVAPLPAGGFVMSPVPASESAFLKSKNLSTATALVFVRRLFELCDTSPALSRILESDGMGGVFDHLQTLYGDNS